MNSLTYFTYLPTLWYHSRLDIRAAYTCIMTLDKINDDLVRERKKCSFDVQELIYLIDYGEKNTMERKKIGEFYKVESVLRQSWDLRVCFITGFG